jgi:hypothetical protein
LQINLNRRSNLEGVNKSPPPFEVSWKIICKMRKWTESRNSNVAVVVVISNDSNNN